MATKYIQCPYIKAYCDAHERGTASEGTIYGCQKGQYHIGRHISLADTEDDASREQHLWGQWEPWRPGLSSPPSYLRDLASQVVRLKNEKKSDMRRFILRRIEDATGISGVGDVAEGVEFSEGTVALKWLTPFATIEICQNVKDVIHVHGHGGKTVIVWLDEA